MSGSLGASVGYRVGVLVGVGVGTAGAAVAVGAGVAVGGAGVAVGGTVRGAGVAAAITSSFGSGALVRQALRLATSNSPASQRRHPPELATTRHGKQDPPEKPGSPIYKRGAG